MEGKKLIDKNNYKIYNLVISYDQIDSTLSELTIRFVNALEIFASYSYLFHALYIHICFIQNNGQEWFMQFFH